MNVIPKAHCHSPSPIIVWHFRDNLWPYYHVLVAYFEAVSAVATAVTVFSGVTTIAVVAATKAGSWGKPHEQLDFSTLWGSWETQVLVVPRAAYQSSKKHAAIRFLLSYLEYLWMTCLVLQAIDNIQWTLCILCENVLLCVKCPKYVVVNDVHQLWVSHYMVTSSGTAKGFEGDGEVSLGFYLWRKYHMGIIVLTHSFQEYFMMILNYYGTLFSVSQKIKCILIFHVYPFLLNHLY